MLISHFTNCFCLYDQEQDLSLIANFIKLSVISRFINMREHLHLMSLPHTFEIQPANFNAMCQGVPCKTASDMGHQV